jgi:hypothetical protein
MSMTSILKDVVDSPVVLAKDIAKVFTIVAKTDKVINTLAADRTKINTMLKAVLNGALAIDGDIATVIATEGLNWTADTAIVADVEAYFKNVIEAQLIPVVEKVYEDIKVDVVTTVATPTASAVAAGMSPTP